MWTCGRTLQYRISNTTITNTLGMEPITEKLTEGRLRWYGHVQMRLPLAPVRKVNIKGVEGKRRKGSPSRTHEDSVRRYIDELGFSEDITSDRTTWRSHIRVEG